MRSRPSAIAAALVGWRARMLPEWSHATVAALTGIDRDEDFVDAEREEPGCVLAIDGRRAAGRRSATARALVDAVRRGQLVGTREPVERGSRRVDVHRRDRATRRRIPGVAASLCDRLPVRRCRPARLTRPPAIVADRARALRPAAPQRGGVRRPVVDRRRGVLRDAVARHAAAQPRRGTRCGGTRAFTSLLFVHRVDGLDPGLYLSACAIRRRSTACAPPAAASSLWSRSHAIAAARSASRAATAARSPQRVELRSGRSRRRVLQPRHDRRLRREPRGARAGVLPPSVLGIGRRRADALSRGRGRRRARAPASAASTTIRCTTSSGSRATRFRACITSPSACRWRTRG